MILTSIHVFICEPGAQNQSGFFAHLIVLHILLFCTSYCFLHILLFCTSYCFAHLIVLHILLFCTSYCFLHILSFCTSYRFAHLIVLHILSFCTSYCYLLHTVLLENLNFLYLCINVTQNIISFSYKSWKNRIKQVREHFFSFLILLFIEKNDPVLQMCVAKVCELFQHLVCCSNWRRSFL